MSDILNPAQWFETDALNVVLWPEGMPAKNVNDAARTMMGALKRFADQISVTETSTGTATDYALTYDIAPEDYYNGQRFSFIANLSNTQVPDKPTLNINSLGPKRIFKLVGGVLTHLDDKDITANDIVEVVYIAGTTNAFVLLNSVSSLPDASTTNSGVVTLATNKEVIQGSNSNNDVVSAASLNSLWKRGLDVTVTAGAIILGEGGLFHVVAPADWTGGADGPATSITFADPSGVGRRAFVIFDTPGKLKNSASLVLPTSTDIPVLAGDICLILLDIGSVTRVLSYTRASGQALTAGNFIYVYKPTDQSLPINSVTLVPDTDLKFTAKAGVIYNFRGSLDVFPSSVAITPPGWKVGIKTSTALAQVALGFSAATSQDSPPALPNNFVAILADMNDPTRAMKYISSTVSRQLIEISGTIVGGSNDSDVTIMWAQGASSPSITIVKKTSYIAYQARS